MKTFKLTSISILAIIFIVVSCKKDDSKDTTKPSTELSTSNQVSITDDQVTEGIATAMDAADGTEDGSADLRPVSCATITANADTKTITIDFGTGCVNPVTHRTRSGKIIVGYTGANYINATARTIEFVNYKTVDSVTLNGTFTQSNIVRTDSTSVAFTLSASNFTFLFADGKTHTLVTYTRDFAINLGSDHRSIADNTTTISGSTTGINKEGEAYSVTITTPVVISGACALLPNPTFYPTVGSYDIKIGNRPKFSLSWGTGDCDKIITVTYLGFSADITLE
ncbi:MAG: hypothetical protein ABUT20_35545 [Bacteroidota bacterium]